jgi:hypothetical protein
MRVFEAISAPTLRGVQYRFEVKESNHDDDNDDSQYRHRRGN